MSKKIFLGLALISLGCFINLDAHKFPKQLVIIGDSLSDQGNSSPIIGSQLPPTPIRYIPITDGVPWNVYLAQKLGAEQLLPYVQGGTNYAYAGALTNAPLINPSLQQQVGFIPPSLNRQRAAAFVWGGANDIFFLPPSPTVGITAGINVANIAKELVDQGFKSVVAFNLPDLGRIPSALLEGPPTTTVYTAESNAFNASLIAQATLNNSPVFILDIHALFESVIQDPQRYGLNNVTEAPALTETTAGFAFWYDGTHPTEATHRLVSDYAFAQLSAPGFFASLAEVPTGMLRAQRAVIHQQMFPVQPKSCDSKLCFFLGGSYMPLLFSPMDSFCNKDDATGGNLEAGFTYQMGREWTFGVAGSYLSNDFECLEYNNSYKYNPQAGVLSLFFDFSKSQGYINGIFNVAWIDYGTITRRFYIGPSLNIARGQTHGIDYDNELYGAYFVFTDRNFQTGPFASINYQHIHVNGYSESGSVFGNLTFRDQNNSILTTGLGWEGRFKADIGLMCLTADASLAANRQWLNRNDNIFFQETSQLGVFGFWYIERSHSNYVSGEANVTGTFKSGSSVSLGYNFNVGSGTMSEHIISLSANYPLY